MTAAAGLRPARRATCTSAICGRRCWPGCSRVAPGGRSGCGWRISTGWQPVRPNGSWPTWRRSGWTGTAQIMWQSQRGRGLSRRHHRAGERRSGLRVLLYPAGDPAGALCSARSRGRLSRHVPQSDDRSSARAPGSPDDHRPCGCVQASTAGPFTTTLIGDYTGAVDDLVLRRGDGVVAYNLAVVVDDAAQGVDQVVRGDDLLSSAPRQAYLAQLLGLPPVGYAHVPLALQRPGCPAGQARRCRHAGRSARVGRVRRPKSSTADCGLARSGATRRADRHRATVGALRTTRASRASPWVVDPQAQRRRSG